MVTAMHSQSEGRFTKPRPDCPHPERWHSYDGDATEYEVLDFMWGLTRAVQPDVVLETGTHRGHMTERIAEALRENGRGVLHSYEPNADKQNANGAWVRMRHLEDHVELHTAESMQPWGTKGPIDLAWFDSLLPLREAEFNFYLPFMHARTVVAFHDAGPHHGTWSNALRRHPRLLPLDLPTPRGCLVGRVLP